MSPYEDHITVLLGNIGTDPASYAVGFVGALSIVVIC